MTKITKTNKQAINQTLQKLSSVFVGAVSRLCSDSHLLCFSPKKTQTLHFGISFLWCVCVPRRDSTKSAAVSRRFPLAHRNHGGTAACDMSRTGFHTSSNSSSKLEKKKESRKSSPLNLVTGLNKSKVFPNSPDAARITIAPLP